MSSEITPEEMKNLKDIGESFIRMFVGILIIGWLGMILLGIFAVSIGFWPALGAAALIMLIKNVLVTTSRAKPVKPVGSVVNVHNHNHEPDKIQIKTTVK